MIEAGTPICGYDRVPRRHEPSTIVQSVDSRKQSDPAPDLFNEGGWSPKAHSDAVSLANRLVGEGSLLVVLLLRGEALCRVQ